MMNSKAWYLSKTLWVNALAIIGLILGGDLGIVSEDQWISVSAGLLAVINILLRLITGDAVVWKQEEKTNG